ncbi:MAG: nicotinate (nicotinamide) nucleotide adenylyltransferase, partial [Phycisphaerae bacterium]
MKIKAIALFGGSFDPIHLGHIRAADAAYKIIGADKLVFIPAKRSALKPNSPAACDADRLNMVRLAIGENDRFEISDCELQKPFPSFTLDTVRRFKSRYGNKAAIYWLLGADGVKDLPLWHNIEELIDECFITIMRRPEYDVSNLERYTELWGAERVKKLQENIIQTPLIDISSTEIRDRIAKNLDVS